MKSILFFLLLALPAFLYAQDEDLNRCVHATSPVSAEQMLFIKKLDEQVLKYMATPKSNLRTEAVVYTIPVVVHVVYNADIEFVSFDQVVSQLEVLNKDYRRLNSDTGLAPTVFKSIGADANLKFVLARQDPSGNPTSGVTFTKTSQTSFSYANDYMKYTSLGGIDVWDPNEYLNIWVCNLNGGILGYVPYPLPIGSSNDGVTISYRAFGTTGTNLSSYFNKGRTATHEIGHWLGLYHPWGKPDSAGCTTDEVDDTPIQAGATDYKPANCPVFPYVDGSSCNNAPNGRIFPDFMDYTRDACMSLFTNNQVDKMRTTLLVKRPSILTSNALQSPYKYDLAVSEIRLDTSSFCKGISVVPKVRVSNFGSDTITRYNITSTLNGNAETRAWSGILLPGKDTVWSFSSSVGSLSKNVFEAKVELNSPFLDQYEANDTSRLSFSCLTALSIYPNPVINILKIRGNSPNVISAIFYNLEGKEMLKVDAPFDIDVTSLLPGAYVVVFLNNSNKITQKLIIIH